MMLTLRDGDDARFGVVERTKGMAHRRSTSQARRGSGGLDPEAVRIRLLGGLRVSVGSRAVEGDEWRLRKAASLVKLLALAEGHRLHRDRISSLLWPDLDEKPASNNLHRALHYARAALEPHAANNDVSRYLPLVGDMLTLCPDWPLWTDVEAFERSAATARRGREPAAYRAAIELYAGELLPENRYEAWAEERGEALRETHLALLVELAALYEELGKPAPALDVLQKVVSEEPAHEEAHAGLMRLYARTGQRYRFLRQYEQLRQALRRELDAEPGVRTKRLYQEILAGRIPAVEQSRPGIPPEGPPPARHNLPHSLTSFVGREREAVEVEQLLLGATRLLTLTGTGGSGKTRLALEVARSLVEVFPGGVWFVELASLAEGALVPQAVAAALGVSERPDRPLIDTLVDALREERMLLVLDNCEHLISACTHLLETLLGSCPDLRVLDTSREILGLRDETVWPVPPLSGPPHGRPPVEELEGYESVRLFVERARSREPGFTVDPENMRAVAEICRRLDGIPLAIELAAARVGTLDVGRISERLSGSLELLTGGSRTATRRQRTLRGALDWSCDLLTEGERKLFCRLSAFAGGWTLAAAEAVGAEPGAQDGIEEGEVLGLLSWLVDKSLVTTRTTGDGRVRFGMLEPVRQYASERLAESGEAGVVRRRHAGFFLELAEEADPELTTGAERRVAWLEQLGTERDNLRAALSWMLDEEEELGLRLAAALWKFWNVHSLSEGRRWLEAALEKGSARSAARAKALNEAGWMARWQGDYGRAMALLEESFALFEELGNKPGAALALANLGTAAIFRGDGGHVVGRLREEAEALRPELSDRRASAYLLIFLAMAALDQEGDESRMIALHEESLALFRELEDVRGISMCLIPLGIAALKHGNPEKAAALLEEDLRLLRKLREKSSLIYNLLGVAGVATLRGEPARAARLWGAAQAFREATGIPMSPFLRSHYDYERYVATARAGLSEAAFDAAFSEGQTMSPDQAVEYALTTEEPASRATPALRPAPDVLTHRQREVADLIGRGFTNRRIAQELGISEHTAITHVRNILKKLGFSSRAQIFAWTAQPGTLP